MADHPPTHQDPHDRSDQELDAGAPDVVRMTLGLLAACVGGALGATAAGFLFGSVGILLPLAGLGAGYCASMVCPAASKPLRIGVGLISFVAAVFCETFIYENDGVLKYMLDFFDNGSGMDWFTRVINVIVGYWFCRR